MIESGKTTEELINAWRTAESAMNETAEGSVARMFATQQADEAREAYQARIDELAETKVDQTPRGR
jgi:hypothetical protein